MQVPDMPPTEDIEYWSLCRLAYVFEARGQHGKSRALFEAAVRLRDSDPYAWHALGVACRAIGEYQRANDAFYRAMALDSGFEAPRLACAEMLHGLGYPKEAADLLRPLASTRTPAGRRATALLSRWKR